MVWSTTWSEFAADVVVIGWKILLESTAAGSDLGGLKTVVVVIGRVAVTEVSS